MKPQTLMDEYLQQASAPAWQMWREDGDILVTPDGDNWRIERRPNVGDLVRIGDWVKTNYGTCGLVIAVNRYETCCCPRRPFTRSIICKPSWEEPPVTLAYHRAVSMWTITYVIPGAARQNKAGEFYDSRDYRWIGECVAVGNRILKLFENNHDEVFVVPAPAEALRLARPTQLRLL